MDAEKNIIDAATILFAEKGFEGASIRDIAKKAKVNGAMVSYYFGGKKALYVECLSRFTKNRTQHIESILVAPKNKEEFQLRLRLFLENMFSVYTTDSNILKILMREMQNERKGVTQELLTHVTPLFFMVEKFLQSAIDSKILRKGVSAQYTAMMIMAVLSHPCHAEIAMKKTLGFTMQDTKNQQVYIDQFLHTFFNGVLS